MCYIFVIKPDFEVQFNGGRYIVQKYLLLSYEKKQKDYQLLFSPFTLQINILKANIQTNWQKKTSQAIAVTIWFKKWSIK